MTTTDKTEGYFTDDGRWIELEAGDVRYPDLFDRWCRESARRAYAERQLARAQSALMLVTCALGLALGAVVLMWATSGCPFHFYVSR